GDQRQADDDLEGARPQQQPHARGGQHADGGGDDKLHHDGSPASAASSASAAASSTRALRSDWWARATRISTVAPTTRMTTPRSNRTALARGTRPRSGRSAYWKPVVRNGRPRSQAPAPLA